MGLFHENLSKQPQLSIFRPIECHECLDIFGWFQKIKFKKNDLQTPKNWFFSSKISIWVLKRIVLTRWERFLTLRIHQSSLRTQIRKSFTKVLYNYIMCVQNKLWWLCDIKKRSQLTKTIGLSTKIDIFGENEFNFCLGWEVKKWFFYFIWWSYLKI